MSADRPPAYIVRQQRDRGQRCAAPGSALARRAIALAGLAVCQAALGVFTLIWVVPIGLALAHYALALLLFGMAVVHYAAIREGGERDET